MRRPIVWAPLSAALLLIIVWRSGLWEASAELPPLASEPLVLALALNGVVIVLWGVRMGRLLASAAQPIPGRAAVTLSAMAYAVNSVTPASTGELLRALVLKHRYGVDYATGGGVILIERIGALYYLASSALAVWVVRAANLPPVTIAPVWLLLAYAPLIVGRTHLRPGSAIRLAVAITRQPWSPRVGDASQRLDRTITEALGRIVPLSAFAATSAGLFACFGLQLVLVASAIGAHLDPVLAWGSLGVAMTAGVLSMLPFGLGATDVVLASLLSSVGLSPIQAGATTIAYRLVSTLPLGLTGVAAYWLELARPRASVEPEGRRPTP